MSVPLSLLRLSPLARRGGLVVFSGAFLLCMLAALPFVWHGSLREQAAARSAELGLLREKVRARTEARGPALGSADQVDAMFVPGSTPGTTLATFQSIVSETAQDSGLSILRMQPLPTDEVQGLSTYRLAVDAAGSLDQLRSFLVSVEAALPIVIVTGFDIQPRSAEASAGQSYPSENLAVSLRLEAYAWRTTP